jgi:hypothetical protein
MNVINYLRKYFGLKPKSKFGSDKPVGWSALASLLNDLDEISKEHEEIYDTEVRERLWAYLESRFIRYDKATQLPEKFGMFSEDGNKSVRKAFASNTISLDAIIEVFELDTDQKREITFTNPELTNDNGNYLDSYFGAP